MSEYYITPVNAELSLLLAKFNAELEDKLDKIDTYKGIQKFRLVLTLNDEEVLECYEEGVRVTWKSGE